MTRLAPIRGAVMTPKGILAYAAGVLCLFAGSALTALLMLSLALAPRVGEVGAGPCLLFSFVMIFVALNLIGAGLYRMLNHLYRAVSRTDPATDRPLRGRSLFV